jgi:hypothetical protein
MPRKPSRPPKYRHYKPKDLAVVRIDGRDHYPGKYGSPESHERYDRLIAEWLLSRQTKQGANRSAASLAPATPPTVNELILAFMQHAERRYVKNGKPTSEIHSYRVLNMLPKIGTHVVSRIGHAKSQPLQPVNSRGNIQLPQRRQPTRSCPPAAGRTGSRTTRLPAVGRRCSRHCRDDGPIWP